MDALTFLKTHDPEVVERVVKAAGTNRKYFSHIAYGHRSPSPALALRLERESGGEMTRYELRPDIYARPDTPPPPPEPPDRRSGQDRRQSANRRAEESPGRRQGDDRRAADRRQGENCQEETDAA